MGIRAACSTVMILAPNKSDKIDLLIKSKLDALISGTYTTKLSGVELSDLMFMKPYWTWKNSWMYIKLEVNWNVSLGFDPNWRNKGDKSHDGQ